MLPTQFSHSRLNRNQAPRGHQTRSSFIVIKNLSRPAPDEHLTTRHSNLTLTTTQFKFQILHKMPPPPPDPPPMVLDAYLTVLIILCMVILMFLVILGILFIFRHSGLSNIRLEEDDINEPSAHGGRRTEARRWLTGEFYRNRECQCGRSGRTGS
ncbi:hypothetical protein BU23DRAFT_97664 [Bimuria novae-zelandiae CBS 107.79]|uniref:Uncharacterized protein n=1 Tax=Bimuria novae-zelandiae CBS 107.79 TaxID=1447943 RepID=A0A6A5VQ64_9PLEO|nr:hypothetical protein BU23DRAFT_97664 [Bimuria novae-zelandiae CBS 107.79]